MGATVATQEQTACLVVEPDNACHIPALKILPVVLGLFSTEATVVPRNALWTREGQKFACAEYRRISCQLHQESYVSCRLAEQRL